MPNPKSEVLSIPLMASLTIPLPGRRYTDMESEDYHFYQGLVYLLENDVSTLGYDLTFSTEVHVTPAPPNPGDPPQGHTHPQKTRHGDVRVTCPPPTKSPWGRVLLFSGCHLCPGGVPKSQECPLCLWGWPLCPGGFSLTLPTLRASLLSQERGCPLIPHPPPSLGVSPVPQGYM